MKLFWICRTSTWWYRVSVMSIWLTFQDCVQQIPEIYYNCLLYRDLEKISYSPIPRPSVRPRMEISGFFRTLSCHTTAWNCNLRSGVRYSPWSSVLSGSRDIWSGTFYARKREEKASVHLPSLRSRAENLLRWVPRTYTEIFPKCVLIIWTLKNFASVSW